MVLLSADPFTRPDNASLGSTGGAGTLDPMAWHVMPAGAVVDLNGNTARGATFVGGHAGAWVDLGSPNIDCQVTMATTGSFSQQSGVLFRYVDDNNYYYFASQSGTGIGFGTRLYKRVGGTTTLVTTISATLATGVVIRVVTSGDRVKLYVAGTLVYNQLHAELNTATKFGVFCGGNSVACTTDNWSASTGPVPLPIIDDINPEYGETSGGETIVILGENFTGATAVKFGATNAASYTVVDNYRINAVAPAHVSGAVNIKVTTPTGDSVPDSISVYRFRSPISVSELLSEDSFNRINVNFPVGNTDGGGVLDPLAWPNTNGFMGITGNQVWSSTPAAGGNPTHTVLDLLTPNVHLSIKETVANSSAGSGLVFRWRDNSTYWTWGAESSNILRLRRHYLSGDTSGTPQIQDFYVDSAANFAANDVLEVDASGNVIRCYQNGVLKTTVVTTILNTQTKHGIFQLNNQNRQDDWSASTSVSLPVVSDIGPNEISTVGNENVVITGANFTGVTAVKFGATNAISFTFINDGRLQAVAPPHAAGLVNVTVTTPSGTSALDAANEFTYANPGPFIASVFPDHVLVSGGETVVITGTAFLGTTSVTFGATPAASFDVDSDTQITAVTPAHSASTVPVVVTTPDGSSL